MPRVTLPSKVLERKCPRCGLSNWRGGLPPYSCECRIERVTAFLRPPGGVPYIEHDMRWRWRPRYRSDLLRWAHMWLTVLDAAARHFPTAPVVDYDFLAERCPRCALDQRRCRCPLADASRRYYVGEMRRVQAVPSAWGGVYWTTTRRLDAYHAIEGALFFLRAVDADVAAEDAAYRRRVVRRQRVGAIVAMLLMGALVVWSAL